MCMQISYTKLDVTSRDCSKVDRRKARLPSFTEIITVFRDVALTGQWSSPSGCCMEFEFDGKNGVLRGSKV